MKAKLLKKIRNKYEIGIDRNGRYYILNHRKRQAKSIISFYSFIIEISHLLNINPETLIGMRQRRLIYNWENSNKIKEYNVIINQKQHETFII